MKKNNNSKRGFTLVELVIVLAVLVIASGMVVTFSTMMHGAQGVSNARYEALQDVRAAESLIEGFIEDNADKELRVQEDYSIKGDRLYYTQGEGDGAEDISVFLANGGAFVVSGNEVMFLESLDSIEFEKVGDDDILYYCTIKYSVSDTQYTYTFCVNPYVGEGGNS